jgi:Iap family predicted aminopeptidase
MHKWDRTHQVRQKLIGRVGRGFKLNDRLALSESFTHVYRQLMSQHVD